MKRFSAGAHSGDCSAARGPERANASGGGRQPGDEKMRVTRAASTKGKMKRDFTRSRAHLGVAALRPPREDCR